MRTFTSPTRALIISSLLVGLMALLGAFPSYAQNCTIYVDASASGGGDGSDGSPYTNLQDGLDDATSASDVVCVAEGTYNTSGGAFSMAAGTSLIGGFSADFGTQDVSANPTILDGGDSERVLVVNSSGTSTLVEGVAIQNGSAQTGGGLAFSNQNSDGFTLRDVTFQGNVATNGGGGGANIAGLSSLVLENVRLIGNEASGNGGGLRFKRNGASARFKNVLARGNHAGGNGGAFWLNQINLEMVNATVSGNFAEGEGGGLQLDPQNNSEIINSVFWANDSSGGYAQIVLPHGNDLTFITSDVEGSGGSGAWNSNLGSQYGPEAIDGGGNLDQNPYFDNPVDPSSAPTSNGGLHVQEGSPAVDAGTNSAIGLSFDIEGEDRVRPQGGTVDIGAYEGAVSAPSPTTLYVSKASGNDGNTGGSWGDAFANVSTALNEASSISVSVEIWVAEGVYYPDEGTGTTPDDKGSSFVLENRVSIYGGFSGGESERTSRSPESHPVILSGDIDDNSESVFASPPNDEGNAYHVVTAENVSSRTVLDGVTITGGYASGSGDDALGGGLLAKSGSPRLTNVRIIGNRASQHGGGVAVIDGGAPTLTYGDVKSNEAGGDGGGIYMMSSSFRLTNTVIAGNEAQGGNGGGVYANNPQTSTFSNLVIKGNRAVTDGGGIYETGDNGAAGTLVLNTSTLSGNYAGNIGGGVRVTGNGTVNIRNSILWGDAHGGYSGQQELSTNSTINVSSSLIEGGNQGSINQDPLFLSDPTDATSAPTTDGNVDLESTSPALDQGDRTLLPNDISDVDNDGNTTEKLPLDIGGGTRDRGSNVDIGAYERSTIELTITGTDGADGTDAGWRDMGVPVEGIQVSDVKRKSDRTELQNLNPERGRGGVWKYDDGWKSLSSSDPLPNGHGFSVYLRDEGASKIDPNMSLMPIGGNTPGDKDVTVGEQVPLSTEADFNFLANPYGVSYDLLEVEGLSDHSKFQGNFQIWKTGNGGYDLINLQPFEKTGISPWQAFFVERNDASQATQVTFPKEGRSPSPSNANPFHGSKSDTPNSSSQFVSLSITATNSEGTVLMKDRAANVLLRSGAKEIWDPYDATKLVPPTNKYALIGPVGTGEDGSTVMKAQESRPIPTADVVEIPLALSVKNYRGPLTLSLTETVNIEGRWKVTLIDTKGTASSSDDEEKVLTSTGDGYEFSYGSGETKGVKTKARQVGPPTPDPVDWTPLGRREAKKGASSTSKSASDKPVSRFKLRLEKSGKLPVELAGFEALGEGQNARLTWETVSETNNEGFYVEHQRLAPEDSTVRTEAWSSLGFVEGEGTSNQPQQYRYRTKKLEYGRHAFRLRQVDLDGTVHHSEPIVIEAQLDGKVAIEGPNPNPVRQNATLDLTVKSGQEVTVQLYDVLGRQVKTIEQDELEAEQTRTLQIGTEELSSGAYFLRVRGDQFQRIKRITVVR